jgi:hypothetical protein
MLPRCPRARCRGNLVYEPHRFSQDARVFCLLCARETPLEHYQEILLTMGVTVPPVHKLSITGTLVRI